MLTLTKKAMARFELAAPIMKAKREALMQGISKSDRDAFFRVLDELDNNIAQSVSETENKPETMV